MIVSAVRTPIGSYGGSLRNVPAYKLASLVLHDAVKKVGVDPWAVDDVITGQSYQNGECQRLRYFPGLSHRGHRGNAYGDADPRDGKTAGPLRARDNLRRWRAGHMCNSRTAFGRLMDDSASSWNCGTGLKRCLRRKGGYQSCCWFSYGKRSWERRSDSGN